MYLRGTPLAVILPGTQERNFTHVDDIIDGLVRIGEKGQGDEYGLGNEKSYGILDTRGYSKLKSYGTWAREIGWNHRSMPQNPGFGGCEAERRDISRNFREELREAQLSWNFAPTTFHPVAGLAEHA